MSSIDVLSTKEEEEKLSSAEEEDEISSSSAKKGAASSGSRIAAFQLLMDEEGGGGDSASSDGDEAAEKEEVYAPKPAENSVPPATSASDKKKKQQQSKKKDKKGKQKEINAPKEPKKKKTDNKKETVVEGEEEQKEVREEDGTAQDTTLAAEEGKKKKKKKKKEAAATNAKTEEEPVEKMDEIPIGEGEEAEKETEEKEREEGAKKKDKKRKKKEKKDEEETDKKKPSKKHEKNVAAIKEMLKKKQDEEERIRKQQEEEQQRLEALEREREEKERLEREKRDREKERKRLRDEQLKKEGKYMTAAQKAKRAKDQQRRLEMESQGIYVPALSGDGNKSRPVYRDRKKEWAKKQKEQQAAKEKSETPEEESGMVVAVEESKETEKKEETMEDVAEAWDADVTDSWEKIEHVKEEGTREDASKEKEEESESEEESSQEEEESTSEEESSTEEEGPSKEDIRARVVSRIKKRREDAEAARSTNHLRAPVICVLGHVDTGKTKILDKIRKTHVQDGEAGGITQQIGATMVPEIAIAEEGNNVKDLSFSEIKVPGFLIIDTPGHESFSNLRSRGSSLCDLAVLVVDIMHGIEPQTLESIELLLKRKTPFVIALNKVDRLYNWKQNAHKDIRNVLKSQDPNTQLEFQERYNNTLTQFAEKGLNVALFWENPDPKEYYSMIPTSALSGDGMGNLMVYIAQYCQDHMTHKLAFSEELDCTVLEVKTEAGLGKCIDVVLVNGRLRVGDVIVVAGLEGPIVTQIRELLMPQPLRELRVKNPYQHFKEVKAAQGIRILAKDLDKTLAGLPLLVAHRDDEVDVLRQDVSEMLEKRLRSYKVSERGVYVQASTLGSLEALLAFLDSQKISYCGINIGPVHRKDVMKTSTMLEHDPQWAVILAFDVQVDRDAQAEADKLGVKIMTAPIIYHLQDKLLAYREELRLKKRQENAHLAIFPCKLRILPNSIFNKRDPIVIGVSVEAGQVKPGTPICVPSKENLFIGTIAGIEMNHKSVDLAKSGMEVCIKIENTTGDAPKMYDRHFTSEDILVSRICRESIDVCKAYFREDLTKDDWRLIVELKKLLKVF